MGLHLGCHGLHLGGSWAPSGGIMGSIWGDHGAPFGGIMGLHLGCHGLHLGGSWAPFGGIMGLHLGGFIKSPAHVQACIHQVNLVDIQTPQEVFSHFVRT